ncbi:MAG: Membrane-associated zinc metalloprotease [Candidatus Roizmanbacteria bacterium GW2011_GWA2_37_7]|uniref:Membrane-associated zinc metalloprotease n=1 Tax=Candidatus Roizmanbacteria bacterium GW2011_GWA2_37_7 TaxID=1618481 RepID=A0A0G0H2T3_9BACT|nr:MAG: Membrane-associated zinc metalloprotease [Candidatus Roizmanbacteria bacterium GW2011_GWA2_37_7]
MTTALTFLLILIILVLIHEFGHYFAAKKSGVLVEEFGFGFPPRLFGKKIGETLYSINLIPLGGFVRLYGEDHNEVKNKKIENSKIPSHRAFVNKTPFQKTIIITAGVVMNIFFGWILISILYTQGVPSPVGVTVNAIQKNSPASEAGLKIGDKLISITHSDQTVKIITTDDLVQSTQRFADEITMLQINRGDKIFSVQITPRSRPPKDQGALGIVIEQQIEIKHYPWYMAFYQGFIETLSMTKTIAAELLKIPVQLISRQSTDVEFTGPVGIAKIVNEARKFGITALIQITAILSINLAVINILPFPALDGGRQIFILYEWVTGKRANQNLEHYLNIVGIILLLTLSAVITIFDIQKYWG